MVAKDLATFWPIHTKVKLGVVGPRDFKNYNLLSGYLNFLFTLYDISYIVSGGKRKDGFGVDTLAEIYADENEIDKIIYPAKWKKEGKSAGIKRNTKIANIADVLFVCEWHGSRGTFDTMQKVHNLNKPVLLGLNGVIERWKDAGSL